MKKIILLLIFIMTTQINAQKTMTPELFWQLKRVAPIGLSIDDNYIVYKVSTPNMEENTFTKQYYKIAINGGEPIVIKNAEEAKKLVKNKNRIATGTLSHKSVKIANVLGVDYYKELDKSNVYIYDALNYRHWDTWNKGEHNHIIYTTNKGEVIDIMKNEPFDCPQKPFGGDEDYIATPDGKKIIYVAKKLTGTAYALSTNTDLYEYDIATQQTKNITPTNKGYDVAPQFSPMGELSWLQMKRDGYEADKNDIIVRYNATDINVTKDWDGTVDSFTWGKKGEKIYFLAPIAGTKQLFEISFSRKSKKAGIVKQLTKGQFNVNSIIGFSKNKIIVKRGNMNSANEIFSFDLKKKQWQQITHENTKTYQSLHLPMVKKRMVTTTDGKEMLTWVIYPPNFDASKKYPTLLYCQGGPQGALSQFYSFRWNFQLMASQGYIVVAPNRRGMPGYGVEWNEAISKDWGGQAMDDYLSAIDDIAKEKYVDTNRLGAIGASYGGYSVFYLAGIHNNRFKTFISHCGVFNLESMYGTTEELFFTNWDMGGAYWETENKEAIKTYAEFNPKNKVNKWNTPIFIIQGAKDYRVPIGQGQEAFQVAQLKGIKSKFMVFPEENHWVLQPQNGLLWQREFFKWLKETL